MKPNAGTCMENTLLVGMFMERTARQENWHSREASPTYIHLHKLLHSFSPDRKKPQHKVAASKVRMQYFDVEAEVRKQTCEAAQILSISVPFSVCTQFKLIK